MIQFFKKAFVIFALVSSTFVYAQEQPFSPKFTLGSGFYTLTGDIQNEKTGFLKGIAGFNAGMKFELSSNLDLSFLVIKTAFSADNGSENFKSDIDGFGLNIGYTVNQIFNQSKISPLLSLGIQNFNVRNDGENSGVITVPLGFGLRMNVSDRFQFDIAINFGMGLGDIDMSKENEDMSDGYKSLNFALHYDLFTPKPKENAYFDDSYYEDVDFIKLESEDEDGDLVADVDDFCPKTPIGVKVDANGCPFDDDNDGIANYLDQQKNTPKGSIVDEKGARLTDEKYESMYSDYDAASREYANFYNENEIKRENYKTIDAYLIAKANAFNKAYNEENLDNTVKKLKYKVKIGAFIDGVPANVINKYLSLDDLESITQEDGLVIYAVGTYNSWDEAKGREYDLEAKGFNEMSILVDNNGIVSNHVIPVPVIDEDEVVISNIEGIVEENITNKETLISSNKTTYRIQIGAFDKELSDIVFEGVDNVVSFLGKDNLVRYMAGSFTEYKDAISYQAQMKARGFLDAFIVTYKNGERISLNIAIKSESTPSLTGVIVDVEQQSIKPNIEFSVQVLMMKPNVEFEVEVLMTKPNVEFVIQIVVTENSLTTEDIAKMSKLENITKEAKGEEMYRYFAGTYSSLSDANIRLEEARLVGYLDAFIFANIDGKRVTLEQTKYTEILGSHPSLEAANIHLTELKLAGYADAFVFTKLEGKRIAFEQTRYSDILGTYTSLEDANVRLEEAKLEGYADALIFAELEGERITLLQAKELLK